MHGHFDGLWRSGWSCDENPIECIACTRHIKANAPNHGAETSSEMPILLGNAIDGFAKRSKRWQCALRAELPVGGFHAKHHVDWSRTGCRTHPQAIKGGGGCG